MCVDELLMDDSDRCREEGVKHIRELYWLSMAREIPKEGRSDYSDGLSTYIQEGLMLSM